MPVIVGKMRLHDERSILAEHHAAARELAAANYPPDVIDAWAPTRNASFLFTMLTYAPPGVHAGGAFAFGLFALKPFDNILGYRPGDGPENRGCERASNSRDRAWNQTDEALYKFCHNRVVGAFSFRSLGL
jgi:hypothetical protein